MKFYPTPYSKLFATSRRLIVRPYNLKDSDKVLKSEADRSVSKNKFDQSIPVATSRSYDEFKARVLEQRKVAKIKENAILGIFLKKSGDFIGQIDFFTINKQLRWGNLGFVINNQFWGNGYATEAARLALKIGFNDCRYHRIEAGAEPQNKASLKVLKKLRMEQEGKRKKFFPEGGGVDMLIYAANSIDYKK